MQVSTPLPYRRHPHHGHRRAYEQGQPFSRSFNVTSDREYYLPRQPRAHYGDDYLMEMPADPDPRGASANSAFPPWQLNMPLTSRPSGEWSTAHSHAVSVQ